MPDRLAEHVADEDPERDRRACRRARGSRRRSRCPTLASAKSGTIDVARPRVVELLQPLVRRDRRLAAPARAERASSGGRLLAEVAEQLARPLELARGRRGRPRRAGPIASPSDDRVDARLEERDPGAAAEHEVDEPARGRRAAPTTSISREEPRPRSAGGIDDDGLAVGDRDDEQRDDVVDDDDRQHERRAAGRGTAARPARASRARTRCRSTSRRPSPAPSRCRR